MNIALSADSGLSETLAGLLRSRSTSNPALNALIDDYAMEHRVVAVLAIGFALVAIAACIVFFGKSRRAPRAAGGRPTAERRAYRGFAVLSAIVGLSMTVIAAANVTNALRPRAGFEGTIAMVGTPREGTHRAALHQAFVSWLRSGTTTKPTIIQSAIDRRLGWQLPKAIVCTVLLLVLVATSVRVWNIRIQRSRAPRNQPSSVLRLRVIGYAAVSGALLLTLMVLGNSAASFAPLNLTMLFG